MPREEDGGMTPDLPSHDRGAVVLVAADGGGVVEMAHVIVRVAVEVFDTMIGLPLVPASEPEVGGARPPATVVGSRERRPPQQTRHHHRTRTHPRRHRHPTLLNRRTTPPERQNKQD